MQTELFYGNNRNDKGVYTQFIRMKVTTQSIVLDDFLQLKAIYEPLDEGELKDFHILTPDEQKFLLAFENHVSNEVMDSIKKGRKVLYFSDSQLSTIFEIINKINSL